MVVVVEVLVGVLLVVVVGVGAGVVTVVVLAGAVTVVVGVVIVVFCVTVGVTVVVVEWSMLSDWLVVVGVCLEPLSDTSRTTTTISAITSAAPMAMAQPLPPLAGGGAPPP